MDPNFGSGNSTIGPDANAALQSAIARRATGQAGQISAQSPSSAGFNPALQTPALPNPSASPASMVGGGMAPVPGALMGAQTAPSTAAENELILKALDAKLKANAAIEKVREGV